jgi:Holliday junction resolvase RusA-like endonuclease
VIIFRVPGIPKASQTGSVVRLGDGRLVPLRRNTQWGEMVSLVARQYAPPAPFVGPLVVELTYYFARPKYAPRRRLYPAVRPDIENLTKHQLDALSGVLWRDDAQIVDLHVYKRYGTPPGVEVRCCPIDEPQPLLPEPARDGGARHDD